MQKLTNEQAAVISAFTGKLAGPFSDMHEYAERVLGRPIFTHEFASKKVADELAAAAKPDFIAMAAE